MVPALQAAPVGRLSLTNGVAAETARPVTYGQTWLQMGELHEEMYEPDKAERAYLNVLRHEPDSVAALTRLGALLRARGRIDEGMVHYRRILARLPTHAETLGALGHCHLARGDTTNAFQVYAQALQLLPDPTDQQLWFDSATPQDWSQSFDWAIDILAAALKISPNYSRANEVYFRLGLIYKIQGQFERALTYLGRALAHPPRPHTRFDILYHLGHTHELAGQYPAARERYEQVLLEHPRHARTLHNAGWLYAQTDTGFTDRPKAMKLLSVCVEANDPHLLPWYLMGRCYMESGQHTEAFDCYQRCVYDKSQAEVWCSIGVLYFQISQFRDALDAFSRALRCNADLCEVWLNLGALYETCNSQVDDAINAYKRVVHLDPSNEAVQQRLAYLERTTANGGVPPPGVAPPPILQPQEPEVAHRKIGTSISASVIPPKDPAREGEAAPTAGPGAAVPPTGPANGAAAAPGSTGARPALTAPPAASTAATPTLASHPVASGTGSHVRGPPPQHPHPGPNGTHASPRAPGYGSPSHVGPPNGRAPGHPGAPGYGPPTSGHHLGPDMRSMSSPTNSTFPGHPPHGGPPPARNGVAPGVTGSPRTIAAHPPGSGAPPGYPHPSGGPEPYYASNVPHSSPYTDRRGPPPPRAPHEAPPGAPGYPNDPNHGPHRGYPDGSPSMVYQMQGGPPASHPSGMPRREPGPSGVPPPGSYYNHDERQRAYYTNGGPSPGGPGAHYSQAPPAAGPYRPAPNGTGGGHPGQGPPPEDDYSGVAESLISMGGPPRMNQSPAGGAPKRPPGDDPRAYGEYGHDPKRMAYSAEHGHHPHHPQHPRHHPQQAPPPQHHRMAPGQTPHGGHQGRSPQVDHATYYRDDRAR
ncbi:glucose repression mediator protein [Tieghemiomyces parasiticus]|uniref:Glucose repression mediator protein n=1 Tax=Tieghemiomyces parasiticus TaxID=78921 RepID=A0A9W8DVY1_9FUNG|nr:glucose repression mediator protein [Tieghemiomyces parasiticus]